MVRGMADLAVDKLANGGYKWLYNQSWLWLTIVKDANADER